MGVFRGEGGTGDATTDATASQVAIDAQTATTKANEAASSATTASTKASEAATSATNAASSATTASTQATSATNSASAASSSATAAAISRTNASSSETAAGVSASSATAAKVAAETAKTAAETAETNAASSATTATTKASEASTSASNAASSATAAASSATAAANSATAAASSATAAENAKEAIDGLYLGTATSNPTVDGNGNAVTAGDWYFNTSDSTTRIYDGSAWNTVNPDLVGDSSPQLGGNLDLNSRDITGTGNVNITGNISLSGTVDGRDVATDGTKLDGIESGATADQTAAEIRTLVESATDSNVFTDADHTKLNGIEANATADQTAAEIRTLVESATDSNVFTDADHTKLNGIETSADVTDTTNVVAALTAGTNVTIDADGTISSTDTNTQLSNEQVQDIVGAMVTGNTESGITVTYQDSDGTLDFSVASQTDNNFTNADHSKLDGIEASADVTDTTNVVAALTAGTNITTGDHTISESGTPQLILKDSSNAGGGGASGKIIFNNTGGDAIGIGYTGNSTADSDLIISTNAGGTYGGYLGLDANGITDAQADIILEPKTNVRVANGNLLVGTTDNSPVGNNVAGVGLFPNGSAQFSRDGGTPLLINRKTGDGTLIDFRRDGTTFGKIGVSSSNNLTIGGTVADHSGLLFGTHAIYPREAGSLTNGTIAFGDSSYRYKDIYSNGLDITSSASNGFNIVATDTAPDTAFNAMRLDYNVSGSGATTNDRNHIGFVIDVDSSATGGDTNHEHRLYGINTSVTASGDSDLIYGNYSLARANNFGSSNQVTNIRSTVGISQAHQDAGTVSNNIGTYGQGTNISSGSGIVNHTYGLYGLALAQSTSSQSSTGYSAVFGITQVASINTSDISQLNGVRAEIQLDNKTSSAITISDAYVVRAEYDENDSDDASYTVTNGYLFYGNYAGTKPTNAYGVYIVDSVRNYFGGYITTGDGSVSAPSYSFNGDTNTGMFSPADHTLGWATNGAEEMRLTSGGDLHVDGNVIAYSTTISDRRLKSDITNISNALDKVGQINGVTFVRDHNGEKAAGVVAQEIMEVLPEAVKSQALPLQTGEQDQEYYVVEYDAVTGLLVEAVKELKARVEALESQ